MKKPNPFTKKAMKPEKENAADKRAEKGKPNAERNEKKGMK